MKFLYGIAVEEYEALFIMQDGLCAICEQPERQQYWKTGEVKSLCIDHDHLTGKVRALLCSNCNGGLGLFHDDPAKLLAAADYIRSFRSA